MDSVAISTQDEVCGGTWDTYLIWIYRIGLEPWILLILGMLSDLVVIPTLYLVWNYFLEA